LTASSKIFTSFLPNGANNPDVTRVLEERNPALRSVNMPPMPVTARRRSIRWPIFVLTCSVALISGLVTDVVLSNETPPVAGSATNTSRRFGWANNASVAIGQITTLSGSLGTTMNVADPADTQWRCRSSLDTWPRWRAAAAAVPINSIRRPFSGVVDTFSAALRACAHGNWTSTNALLGQAATDLQDTREAARVYDGMQGIPPASLVLA